MMIDKTKFGIEFFDETFGGIYRGRTVFCYGRKGSGKSVIASWFLRQSMLDGDRSLLLTDWQAKDALIVAESVGVPFTHMVRTGNLTILEYSSFIPGLEMCEDSSLPPTAFVELQKIINSRSIRRVVFDTALPWLAIQPIERMPGHVYSFIHALERLNVTTLLTLPWPVSTPAFMLKNRLEDVCPVVFVAQRSEDTGESFFKVSKYLGDNINSATPITFKLNTGKTAVPIDDSEVFAIPSVNYDDPGSAKGKMPSSKASTSLDPTSVAKPAAPTQSQPVNPPIKLSKDEGDPISFSSVIEF